MPLPTYFQAKVSSGSSSHNMHLILVVWEAAVKSMKTHLRRVLGSVRLTYEELSTVLVQVEACLNSHPFVPLPADDDGIGALTPGHFLIG